MIRYHGTPIGGDNATAIRSLQGRHAMVSYARPDQLMIVAEVCQSFALDNGAYSAWTRMEKFDLGGYAEFCESIYRHPGLDWLIMPDVIDGDENDNQKMRAQWQQRVSSDIWRLSVPVWHMHESIGLLRDFCNIYPRVAIGSSGRYSKIGNSDWWQRMSVAMNIACDEQGRPKTKLHGLRQLDPSILSHIPYASADSTNAARNNSGRRWDRALYAPATQETRTNILMERIESHATASRWNFETSGVKQNLELFG